MAPALLPGDRLLVGPAWRLQEGDVVSLFDPRDGGRPIIKRVATIDGAMIKVLGDNPAASTDSRHFGPVARPAIRGKVIYRYAPASRVGRFRQ